MGKKTVLIADQSTQKRKVFMMNKGSGIGVNHAAGNSRIKPGKSVWNMLSGTNMYITGRPSISYPKNITEARTGYGNAYAMPQ
jgi:hypothetical protein